MNLNQEFIASVMKDTSFIGVPLTHVASWSVDSRTIEPGSLFVALAGSKVDGHAWVKQALEAGAVGALISAAAQESLAPVIEQFRATKTFIITASPQEALCALAAAWRKQFSYPVVGITGSVGKTTTKEILGNMLRAQGMNCLVSQGNQNTMIGMSLNILKMRAEHNAAIFEMGISKRGEMAKLVQLALPTMAVITAIGHSHMEGLGSIIDIAAEKRDIFKYLKEDGIGIIDGDQPLLSLVSYRHPIIKFGRKMVNQVQARKIQQNAAGVEFQLKLYNERYPVALETENTARIYNVLAAASAAHALGVQSAAILRGIQEPVAVTGRFKKHEISGTKSVIIDDSYNANPESMKAALQAFEHMDGQHKIAILGDMLELGVNAPFWHRQLGRFLRKVPSVQQVIFVGEQVKWAEKMVPYGLSVARVASWQDAVSLVKPQLQNSLVLVKASHGVGLKNLVAALLS
jgi:UDP-N-acetylmuramoyl-tripeptide--D-alanyl-D-alanine ligase